MPEGAYPPGGGDTSRERRLRILFLNHKDVPVTVWDMHAKFYETFSAKLREETDLDAFSDDLVSVVRETRQPAHVSLRLRQDTASKAEDSGESP